MEQEEIIIKYFAAWLNNDVNVIKSIMSDKITYSECYGPEYHGINQIITWFKNWNQYGTVLKWDIKQFIHQKNVTAVEWYFECNGTLQGCTVVTESLSSTAYYEVEFSDNFIKGVENNANSEMNKDNLVKVQINYGKTRDSIKLKEYFAN